MIDIIIVAKCLPRTSFLPPYILCKVFVSRQCYATSTYLFCIYIALLARYMYVYYLFMRQYNTYFGYFIVIQRANVSRSTPDAFERAAVPNMAIRQPAAPQDTLPRVGGYALATASSRLRQRQRQPINCRHCRGAIHMSVLTAPHDGRQPINSTHVLAQKAFLAGALTRYAVTSRTSSPLLLIVSR